MKIQDSKNEKFKIVFDEIEKFKSENPEFQFNLISKDLDDDLRRIKEFGEICEEIAMQNSKPIVFTTFC